MWTKFSEPRLAGGAGDTGWENSGGSQQTTVGGKVRAEVVWPAFSGETCGVKLQEGSLKIMLHNYPNNYATIINGKSGIKRCQ